MAETYCPKRVKVEHKQASDGSAWVDVQTFEPCIGRVCAWWGGDGCTQAMVAFELADIADHLKRLMVLRDSGLHVIG